MPIDPSQMKGIDPGSDGKAGMVADPNMVAPAADADSTKGFMKGETSLDTGAGKADDSDSDPNSFQARIKKALAGGAKGSQQPMDDDLLRRTMGAAAQRGSIY